MHESKEEMLLRLRQHWNEDHGQLDPRLMPAPFFPGALHLDYDSALKADVTKQKFMVVPRYWYIDAAMHCEPCGRDFCFSAKEQQAWYESKGPWTKVFPRLCTSCRRKSRDLKTLRHLYDRDIAAALRSGDCDEKSYVLTIIDRMIDAEVELPGKVHENRKALAGQIARRRKQGEPPSE